MTTALRIKSTLIRPFARFSLASDIAADLDALGRVVEPALGSPIPRIEIILQLLFEKQEAYRWWEWVLDMQEYYGEDEPYSRDDEPSGTINGFIFYLENKFEVFTTL